MYTGKILCSLVFIILNAVIFAAQNLAPSEKLISNRDQNVTTNNPFLLKNDSKSATNEQDTTTSKLINHNNVENLTRQVTDNSSRDYHVDNSLDRTINPQLGDFPVTTSPVTVDVASLSSTVTDSIQDVGSFLEASTIWPATTVETSISEDTPISVDIQSYEISTDQTSYADEVSLTEIIPTENVNVKAITTSHSEYSSTTENTQTEPNYSENETYNYEDLSNEENNSHTTEINKNVKSPSKIEQLNTSRIVIRKCCHAKEYFNTISSACKPFEDGDKFGDEIVNILSNKSNSFSITSASLQCDNTFPPLIHSGVANDSYVVVNDGEILDTNLNTVYNRSEYCLELVGESALQISFTLAYCQQNTLYDYYYHDHNGTLPDFDGPPDIDEPGDITAGISITVRKCCLANEYYDSHEHRCSLIYGNSSELFVSQVKQLAFENNVATVEIVSERLTICPHDNKPRINLIENHNYRLRYNGDVIEMSTSQKYNQSLYCMEHAGTNVSNLQLAIARCNVAKFILPKCCPVGQYFDEDHLDCKPIPIADRADKLLDNFHIDGNSYAAEPLASVSSLMCDKSFPAKASAEFASFVNGKLCIKELCYNKDEFCIDFIGSENLYKLQAVAYYCRYSYFVKCCEFGEVLGTSGCAKNSDENSVLLKEFLRTKSMVRLFNYNECEDGRTTLLEDGFTKYIQWWLEDSHLVAKSASEVREISHYCIDDLQSGNGRLQPVAYVCESDLKNLIPVEKSRLSVRPADSLGKCCAPKSRDVDTMRVYSAFDGHCQTVPKNDSLQLIDHFRDSNLTQEHYHDLPQCVDQPAKYHVYPVDAFATDNEDYVALTAEGELQIVSRQGRCERRQTLTGVDFCFDYIWLRDGRLQPSAIVCADDPDDRIHEERFHLVTTLLAISCVCLFLTLISLFTMKVRRGIVSVRKVKTVAGRILVSFVGSHFIGFLALAVTQYENSLNKENSSGCYILAGLIQFFNLATFCWNTSICLESLLLTIRIRISECTRYFLHSLWAWGVPLILTMLMLLMDAYKDSLPCGTIIPNIGVHHCFIFETEAKLLYFYLPIFITLVANIFFLVGAKALRTSRLKRLEKGKPRSTETSVNAETGQNGKPPTHHSGMRIHQGQNSTADTVRLVMWTGGTWFLELVGFLSARFIFPPEEETLYYYLWYIPTSLNALRGVGIFIIIAITPEVKQRGSQKMSSFTQTIAIRLRNIRGSTIDGRESMRNDSSIKYSKRWSISTMISSIRNSSMNGRSRAGMPTEVNGCDNHAQSGKEEITAKLSRKMRVTQSPSAGSSAEEYEMRDDTQRKRSLISSTLPNLQEENDSADSHDD